MGKLPIIKTFKNLLFVILSIALLVMIIFYFLSEKLDIRSLDSWLQLYKTINTDLIASAFIAIIATYFLGRFIDAEKQEERHELITDIQGIFSGLRKEEVEAVFNRATRHIENCEEIMVIGTAKQNAEHIESGAVAKYLDATLKRVRKSDNLVYRRITALNLNEPFKKHLDACFANPRSHDIQLIFLENFAPAYTYLIIDDKFLMVSLTYKNETNNHRFCLYTEISKEIENPLITEFRNHFDAIWRSEVEHQNTVVSSQAEFRDVHKYQSEAATFLKRIKRNINTFPYSDSLFQQHALLQLQRLSDNFDKFGRKMQKIEHMSENENLITVFIDYLELLKPGNRYQTITFCSFWESMLFIPELLNKFIRANKTALTKGALVERLLVIDTEGIQSKTEPYCNSINIVIKKNVELMSKCPAYNFRILFSPTHHRYEQNQYNFALITRQNGETLIFKPIRKNDQRIKETEITLHLEDRRELDDYTAKINELLDEWQTKAVIGLTTDEQTFMAGLHLSADEHLKLTGIAFQNP